MTRQLSNPFPFLIDLIAAIHDDGTHDDVGRRNWSHIGCSDDEPLHATGSHASGLLSDANATDGGSCGCRSPAWNNLHSSDTRSSRNSGFSGPSYCCIDGSSTGGCGTTPRRTPASGTGCFPVHDAHGRRCRRVHDARSYSRTPRNGRSTYGNGPTGPTRVATGNSKWTSGAEGFFSGLEWRQQSGSLCLKFLIIHSQQVSN